MNITENINSLYKLTQKCNNICIDTRKINNGDLFIALKGNVFDGNNFAIEAITKGAKYAVIDDSEIFQKNKKYSNLILVKDSLKFLQELAKEHLKNFNIPLIAITGSCGKTITKDLIQKVLAKKYNTFANIGNLNSHIGLPLSILSMPLDTEIGIFEMGARNFNEITELCNILNPTHGLITNIKEVHLDGFKNLKGVVKAKSELFNFLDKNNGKIFLNIDDDMLSKISKNYKNVCSYSIKKSKKEKGIFYNCSLKNNNSLFIEYIDNEKNNFITKIIGNFNINNICAALTLGKYFKVDPNDANEAIITFKNKNNRLEIIEKDTNKILLDAYNSNFASLKGAIEIIDKFNNDNKILIIGEIKELSLRSFDIHKEIVNLTNKKIYSEILFCGNEFFKFKEINRNALFFLTKKDLENYLQNHKFKNSIILLKASRSFEFETLLDFI